MGGQAQVAGDVWGQEVCRCRLSRRRNKGWEFKGNLSPRARSGGCVRSRPGAGPQCSPAGPRAPLEGRAGGQLGEGRAWPSRYALLSASQIYLVSHCFVALMPLYSVYPEINKPDCLRFYGIPREGTIKEARKLIPKATPGPGSCNPCDVYLGLVGAPGAEPPAGAAGSNPPSF